MTKEVTESRGILGLGNLMRTDDAVGMLALQHLAADPRLPAGVPVIEGGVLGMDLIGRLDGLTHIVALDAVDFGGQPGALARFSGAQLDKLPIAKSVHLLGFSDLLGALRLLDSSPTEVVLIGVQPDSTEWGTELTPPVAEALPALIEATFRQLEDWAVLTATK